MIAPCPDLRVARSSRGYALVITLVMVALLAIITIGVFTTTSLERITAKSYEDRYQAELAAQNGLEAAKQTLVVTPVPSPFPSPVPASITAQDTFLVVRADGPPDASGNKPAYYYLAQPADASSTSSSITYYPLFSTDPAAPSPTPQPITLTAPFAPAVPTPAPPPNSTGSDSTSAWNAAKTQRLPTLYSWVQPSPSPSGPSVKWVEMRNPQDTATAPAHNLPYTRYAYWAEDLDGYLDASQVGGQPRTTGTSPKEIAMFTIFAPTQQTDPGNTAATTLINNRPLLFTVPTLQQIAQTTPDLASPNLAVRLGIDTAEQNLVPFGYGYGSAGQTKMSLNPISQFHGKNGGKQFATPISTAMPNFVNRTATTSGGKGHAGTVDYLNNLASNLIDYVDPLDAPTEFIPPGNNSAPPSSRGIGAYPFVVSLYDLNNWVYTYQSGLTYKAVVEVTTYIQLWNPHNIAVRGALSIHYQNSDQINVNGNLYTLSSPPDASIMLTDNPTSDPNKPTFISPLSATGTVNQTFTYVIKAANGAPYRTIQPNEYRVVALPAPGSTLLPITGYGATALPPGLNRPPNGPNQNRISGTPTQAGTYNVTISATNSAGTTSATLVITISP
jgi:cell division septation protein DedD